MAKNFSLDLSKFKKIASDAKSTTLQHADGHEMRIVHAQLSPKMRSQLHELPVHKAAGGTTADDELKVEPIEDDKNALPVEPIAAAPDTSAPAPSAPAPDATTLPQDTGAQAAPPPQMAAAAPDYFTNGTFDVNKFILANPDKTPVEAQTKALAAVNAQKQQVANADTAAIDKQKASIDAYNLQAQKAGLPPKEYPPEVQKAVAAVAAKASITPSPNTAPAASPQAQAAPQGAGDPYGVQATQDAYMKGIGEKEAGIAGEANAISAQSQRDQAILQNQVAQQKQAVDTYKTSYAELEKERQAHMADIQNNLIDPNKYWQDHSKVATGIGLILGGFNFGGGPNAAASFLNEQMNRNIESQKANLGARENLLSANLHQFGNLKDATDMTRIMMADSLANQIKQSAAKANDPMAQARARQALGDLHMQSASIQGQMAARKTLLSGMAAGQISPARIVNMFIQDPEQRKQANAELVQAQELTKFKDYILSGFDQITKENTAANRIMSPKQSSERIKSIMGPALAMLSKETAGRFTEADSNMLKDSIMAGLTDTKGTVDLKRARLNQLISQKMNFPVLENYNITPDMLGRFNSQGQSNIPERRITAK